MPDCFKTSACIKRIVDVFGALVGLILCMPLMLIIALLVLIYSGRPIFYRETRIGLNQRPFRLYKFRSMEVNSLKPNLSVASGDDPRILGYGHFLRAYHLDELPQLWSVLKGDMSLVGPRPYKPVHFERLSESFRQSITSVKPGITGSDSLAFIAEDEALAGLTNPEQVYLENFLPEKAKLQVRYSQAPSTLMDLQIIMQTLLTLFSPKKRQEALAYLRALNNGPSNPDTK